ncbi:MAG: RNA polymerase sigma factor [Lentimicrobiaceae bacterium]|jgi:RNA polymerase sigma-70 factor (ECF subfamily)|nr:RNA polymerase sigma factor [Lentimicrobiaceae bacterium]
MTTPEYNHCVDQFSDGVYRFVLKNIRDEESARDVVQESFTRMWEKVKEVSFEKAKSYLFTTAYHTMIDMLRKENRLTSYEEQSHGKETIENSYSDLKEVLNLAVEKLSDVQRSVLLLRDYEGYSYEEIGRITGLSESQVKVYIYRARVALKEYIRKPELVI